MDYYSAGWINNMSDKETYRHVYHLVRVYANAIQAQDTKAIRVYARLLTSWSHNQPAFYQAAFKSFGNRNN